MVFIDVRETDELQKKGKLQGAIHVPRGLLEFQADPTSPVHKPELGGRKKLVPLLCIRWPISMAAKALHEMGITNVAYVAGGCRPSNARALLGGRI